MRKRRGTAATVLVGAILAGCVTSPPTPSPTAPASLGPPSATPSAAPSSSPRPTPVPDLGAPLAPVERPSDAECDQLQREDRLAAERIRKSVDFSFLGIGTNDEAIDAAVEDPEADIDAIGIPLLPDELAALTSSGMYLDETTPLAFWVHEGRTDLFGGIWVDPPGSPRHVVSVVDGSREALELARCLERDGVDARYVMATRSLAEIREVQERISHDWSMLQERGIRIVSAGPDTIANQMSMEIEGLTDEQAAFLIDRYGDGLLLEALPVPTPYVPLELDEVPFAIGTGPLFEPPGSNGIGGSNGATWELLDGELIGDEIRLRIAIEPAPHGLPLESGPAVLFAGMEADGGTGVGITEPIDALSTTTLPACDDRDCRYEARIVLPANEVLPAVRRLEANGDVDWVAVNMTLVRTFADGTWLQVLPLVSGHGGGSSGAAGRLGAIDGVSGIAVRLGLFPSDQARTIRKGDGMFTTDFDYAAAVERRRVAIGDSTKRRPAASVSLHIDADPNCARAGIAVQTDSGDVAFQAAIRDKTSFDRSLAVLPGVTWRLTLHDGWGIDYERRGGWGVRLGEIRTDGDPLAADASLTCGASPTGTVTVTEQE